MPLDFEHLIPEIDHIIDEIAEEAQRAPGWILNEDDLKCTLYSRLIQIPALRGTFPTQDEGILGSTVHTEITWYRKPNPDRGRARLHPRHSCEPDITIIEPEHLSVLHGYVTPAGLYDQDRVFRIRPDDNWNREQLPSLPSKQFEFGGRAILFELKFARKGMNFGMTQAIERDLEKIQEIFNRLDDTAQGSSVFAYVIVFDKFGPEADDSLYMRFLRNNPLNNCCKIIYKAIGIPPLRRLY